MTDNFKEKFRQAVKGDRGGRIFLSSGGDRTPEDDL